MRRSRSDINKRVPYGSIGRKASEEPEEQNKRAHHNALERVRRDHIKDNFLNFAAELPVFQKKGCRPTRINVLNEGIRFIKKTKKQNNFLEEKIQKLVDSNSDLEKKILLIEKYQKIGNSKKAEAIMRDLDHKIKIIERNLEQLDKENLSLDDDDKDDDDDDDDDESLGDLEDSSEDGHESSEKYSELSMKKEKKSLKGKSLKTVFKSEPIDSDIENMPLNYNKVLFQDQMFN